MSLKLKVLGLSLLATIALSAVAVVKVAANGEGHLVSELTHTDIEGFGIAPHRVHFVLHGFSEEVGCDTTTYRATAISANKTVSELVVTPGYGKCYTTPNGEPGSVQIHVNGCTYKFTIAKGTTDNTEQTVHLQCPMGQAIVITHPNCTITVHPQTINTGITYTKIVNQFTGKDELTVDANAQFTLTRHGVCQFFGTNGTGTLKGSLAVVGYEPNTLKQVNITAT